MSSERNKGYLTMAAGAAGALALLLFPASVLTLGVGAVLGYHGRAWVEELERSVKQ
ncbi:MAG TPA: hypothetical protein H9714_10675 [Candidatus Flavonifractor intestinipullorum]|uniref:Uncharacterized protein n=1 Tax=Candidatus Flavonifractor intestinipullorum TaxID=2838587 RepID=A0A9D2MDL9_9FIRM|nr:hypothetical protein [Candidatus Flavonifractor intestinipullorum]